MSWRPGLSARQLCVLRAVADNRVSHDPLYGDLGPYTLDGRSVSWTVSMLAALSLVHPSMIGGGPVWITRRGLHILNDADWRSVFT